MITTTDFPLLRSDWMLRREDHQIILYKISTEDIRYYIIDPTSAVVLPFLDGSRSFADLSRELVYLFGLPSRDQAEAMLDDIVGTLNSELEQPIELLAAARPTSLGYDPVEFVMPPDRFRPNHRLTRPLSLLLFPSAYCQTDCRYCYADLEGLRSLGHLSLEEWLPILDQAHELGIRLIQLGGGDPMGRAESAEFVAELSRRRFVFMVSTKCRVSARKADLIAAAGFMEPVNGVERYFQISVDSADPETADYLMQRKGYVARALETVGNLHAAGITTRVKAVLTPFNHLHGRQLVETFAPLGVQRFIFSSYAPSYYRDVENLNLTPEMRIAAAEMLTSLTREYPELIIEGDALWAEALVGEAPRNAGDPDDGMAGWLDRAGCSAGRTNLAIGPDGRAFLCEQMPQTDDYFVGDLTKQTIQEVWDSPEVLRFVEPTREQFAGTPCHRCEVFEYCVQDLGYCFRDSLFVFDELHHPPPDCPLAPQPVG